MTGSSDGQESREGYGWQLVVTEVEITLNIKRYYVDLRYFKYQDHSCHCPSLSLHKWYYKVRQGSHPQQSRIKRDQGTRIHIPPRKRTWPVFGFCHSWMDILKHNDALCGTRKRITCNKMETRFRKPQNAENRWEKQPVKIGIP